MMRCNRLAIFVTFLAAIAAGYCFIQAAPAKPADATAEIRLFEIRTYTTEPGKLDALNARFRDHTTKLFEKHGMTNIGYWTPADGPRSKDTLIYVLAHENRAAADKSWQAFRDDPDWIKARGESEAAGPIVRKVESVFLTPTDYSQLQ
jgi:NIPSNAP